MYLKVQLLSKVTACFSVCFCLVFVLLGGGGGFGGRVFEGRKVTNDLFLWHYHYSERFRICPFDLLLPLATD